MDRFQKFFTKTRRRLIAGIVFLLCGFLLTFYESFGDNELHIVSGQSLEEDKDVEDRIPLNLSYDGYEYYLKSLSSKECEIASEENYFPDFGGQYKKLM